VRASRIGLHLAIAGIRAYQVLLAPFAGGACRFTPSCSEYAVAAVETHGAWHGSMLALRRVMRCHPFGGAGIDPVPSRDGTASER